MKNNGNNNDPSLGLNTPIAAKPITGPRARAAQLASALGFEEIDEASLRNRAADGVIPKPVAGLYDINAATLGLLRWYRARAIVKSDLPAQYASAQAMENALGTPRKAIKWLLKNGAGEAQDPANRVAPLPIIRSAFDIICQLADGAITGIPSLEQWNHQTELAKKLRLESENLRHEQLIRDGETLLARDATFAVPELVADQLLWEARDQPLRAALLAAPKSLHRQVQTILSGDGDLPAKLARLETVNQEAFAGILDQLRAKIPKRLNLETVEAE